MTASTEHKLQVLDRIFETKRILYIFQGETKCFYLHRSCKSGIVLQGVSVGYSIKMVAAQADRELSASVRSDHCTQSRGTRAYTLASPHRREGGFLQLCTCIS